LLVVDGEDDKELISTHTIRSKVILCGAAFPPASRWCILSSDPQET
jgi:hypothetical protein